MPCVGIIALCSKNHTKTYMQFVGQNAEILAFNLLVPVLTARIWKCKLHFNGFHIIQFLQ